VDYYSWVWRADGAKSHESKSAEREAEMSEALFAIASPAPAVQGISRAHLLRAPAAAPKTTNQPRALRELIKNYEKSLTSFSHRSLFFVYLHTLSFKCFFYTPKKLRARESRVAERRRRKQFLLDEKAR
jgi:hypothetical protein